MKNARVKNAALTAIIGAASIAVHIVAGTMATQSRLVMIVTLGRLKGRWNNDAKGLRMGRRIC